MQLKPLLSTSVFYVLLIISISSKVHSQVIADAPPFVLTIEQLKNWTSDGPTADATNISETPLATRFTLNSTQLNPTLSNDMQIIYAPDGMNGLANYTKEQSKFNLYNFKHWSYIDKLIWFGGTADQTIQIPSAPWTNTAHKNGVKVYGNVFFAPNVFGGNTSTVTNFLEKDSNGKFITAQKLKEMSTYYKFDGWFINMETNTTPVNGLLMREFVEELKHILPSNQEVIWYDAMLTNGQVRWQNELNNNNSTFLQDGNSRISDGMFINFFWFGSNRPNNSKTTANTIGRSSFDVFTGVDLWPTRNQSAFESGGNRWMEALHTDNSPITSIALFATNAVFQNDRYSNFRNIDTDIERDRFYNAEKHLFGGEDLNPEIIDDTAFKGLSNWIPASSPITALPFKTSFNTGHGRVFSKNGAQTTRNWHDIAKQDILPTWQFAIQGNSNLTTSFDFSTAYNGGNSLKIEGVLKGTGLTNLKLYKTKLPVTSDTKIDITYSLGKKSKTNMNLIVAFTDDPTNLITFNIGKSRSNGWNIKTINLKKYAGKELALIGFQFSSDNDVDDYKINIGELQVFNGPAGDLNPPISNFNANATSIKLGESITFLSNSSTGAFYKIWQFPGGSPSRSTLENPTVTYNKIGSYTVKLITVNHRGFDIEKKIDYVTVDNDPITDFTVNTSTIQVGESVDFLNTSTNDNSWSWSFPGGSPSTSTQENPTVIYNTVGAFDVSLTTTNQDGSNTLTKPFLIAVSDNNAIDHTDPVGTGVLTARAEINEAESKEKAFDNLSGPSNFTKWLDNGGTPSQNDPSWIQIQLPEAKIVNTLTLTSPNDAPDRDPENFRLLGSNNGIDFTLLQNWDEQFFIIPFEKKVLPFSNTKAYSYYRLEITKNRDDVSLTQIAEIELRGPNQEALNTNSILENSEIKLYPVPAKNTITLEGEFPENSVMHIINTTEKKILRSKPIISKTTTIDLSKISYGVYIISITNKEKTLVTRTITIN
ncbi:hypothetical protein AWE51_23575 [Aquimarina aggregata]|uniref:Uncharacterized protein n=1 Tax=Aquimarina aggregata TaxID=1642818 RepID=A0A163B8D6_9FLAO|nr:PKD domain-containing protein [Aquimarina aggregata]KZS41133.1 hypothetical protein AWE51_23575 [Aquimarina aggregata]